jgi:hypothetical protein
MLMNHQDRPYISEQVVNLIGGFMMNWLEFK